MQKTTIDSVIRKDSGLPIPYGSVREITTTYTRLYGTHPVSDSGSPGFTEVWAPYTSAWVQPHSNSPLGRYDLTRVSPPQPMSCISSDKMPDVLKSPRVYLRPLKPLSIPAACDL